ncbi:MAG TPA: DUF1015 domain-containing protein [Dehalococcoidia bacterium]|nr:DUF1015 domain-containing protein [Dehalococcoidia bacterium]
MADVRPFPALRFSPETNLADNVCPPFDTISPEQQRALYARSPHNAVRIELAEPTNGDRYASAAATLAQWRDEQVLGRDDRPTYTLYRQTFTRDGRTYGRTILFARLRLEQWDTGIVLPHEQTFGGPKEDRLKLLRATHLNASPVYLLYRDKTREIQSTLDDLVMQEPQAAFATEDGQRHAIWVVSDPDLIAHLQEAFADETLYVADGHHRYETALGYQDEVRSRAATWTGEEPENFALAALTSAQDPGLVVLPIHRVTKAETPLNEALERTAIAFDFERVGRDAEALALTARDSEHSVLGLAASESPDVYLLSLRDPSVADSWMPQDRSPEWRRLDYSIANYAILQHVLGLQESQMKDYSMVWFTEDAHDAIEQVRNGEACYAVLLKPMPVGRVLDIADAGERMPQKSTFFYPKVPTGIVFNLVQD